MIRERPILFSGPMVRAILEGRKTQTRRVIKTSAPSGMPQFTFGPSLTEEALRKCKPRCRNRYEFIGAAPDIEINLRFPYGLIGSRLWVRECFWPIPQGFGRDPREVIYRATDEAAAIRRYKPECLKWKPSIFMPRWASRLTLEITDVRIERVQDIYHEDSEAEGCPGWYSPMHPDFGETDGRLPREEFRELWDSINAKRGFGWDVNPWVWAISFKVLPDVG